MFDKTFQEIEYEAWSERASYYDDLFTHISSQAIEPILDTVGKLESKHHLDIACGTGHLIGAAAKRGAITIGIDFAETMIDVASENYPENHFEVADALNLPFEDETFDVVTCSFGLLHMEYPQQAVAEAFRVLKTGGQFAFTLWLGNDEYGLHALIKPALSKYNKTVSLPRSWTQLRYPNEDICRRISLEVGFTTPYFEQLPIEWKIRNTHIILDFIQRLSVRTKLVIESQPDGIKQKIHNAILADAESKKVDGILTMGWSALLTCVQKPA